MWDLIVSIPDHCLSFYFSYDVALFQINRSYLCRIRRNRRKRVCCIQFYGEKKKKRKEKKKKVGVIFCRGFIEIKFSLTSSTCVRNATMRLFV